MSQWGEEKTVNGVRFIPYIITDPFVPAGLEDEVTAILLIDNGGDVFAAKKTLSELRERYVHKPYADWLDLL